MAHKVAYIVVFTMAAISAGAWLCRRGADDLDAVRLDPAARGGTAVMSSERPRAFQAGDAMSSKVTDEGAAAEATDNVNSQIDRTAATARSAVVNLNSEANSKGTHAEMDGLSVPEGAPFPISKSIEMECVSGENPDWDCPFMRRALQGIEDERRDTQWAPAMESRIRAAIDAVPGAHIRALACRSTSCAVETDGSFVTGNALKPLDSDLLTSGDVRARERTGNGEESFRIQLWTFKRRR